MSEEFELVRGSANVFRDLNLPNPDLEQFRSSLAAQIIKALDSKGLSVREAEKVTGIPYADFSRVRNVKLDRFTVDRLMIMLGRLDPDLQVEISVRSRNGRTKPAEQRPTASSLISTSAA